MFSSGAAPWCTFVVTISFVASVEFTTETDKFSLMYLIEIKNLITILNLEVSRQTPGPASSSPLPPPLQLLGGRLVPPPGPCVP